MRDRRKGCGTESQLAYVPVGGHAVGWTQVQSHGKEVLHVLLGWGWPRRGHSQGSALIPRYKGKTVNFEAFDLADVKIIGNCRIK